MADVTVSIPLPVLAAGEYFKERHRELPSGIWSGYTNRSNAAFTITGLSEGEYEFEFILVKADGTHCPAVYRTYRVYGDYDCIAFNSQLVHNNGIVQLEITYTIPGGHTDPACGWEIEYVDVNFNTVTIPYTTLPASGKISLTVKNVYGTVRVYALLCNDKKKQCYAGDVVPIVIPPPCIPMSSVVINLVEKNNNGKCEYYIEVTFNQSSPATTVARLNYQQNQGFPNADRFNGSVPILPNAKKLLWKLNPALLDELEYIQYDVVFYDGCNTSTQVIGKQLWRSCF